MLYAITKAFMEYCDFLNVRKHKFGKTFIGESYLWVHIFNPILLKTVKVPS